MKVLVTGAAGQLGWELQRTAPRGVRLAPFTSAELDITDAAALRVAVDAERPDVIINAAAYTKVDKAETEKELAYAVNAGGAANLGEVAAAAKIRLIHLSTDFVFNGESPSPYKPEDRPAPLSVYGASKLAGEIRLREIMTAPQLTIVRTAWVYSTHGNNFVKTMLKLMRQKERVAVVADQLGTPTWAAGLARAIWQIAVRQISGVHHWTDAGTASWYDFAVAVQEEALAIGLLPKAVPVQPISTVEYPTPAKRPACCVLDKSSLWRQLEAVPVHWRASLRKMLAELNTYREK